jgi:pimeloyl-ACP methyl ester carboxylesterase
MKAPAMRRIASAVIALLAAASTAATQPAAREVMVGKLAATLLTPSQPPFPAVVIIAGSGPTDRDGNSSLGIRTDAYKALAQALAAAGIGSLRYDKRPIGGSHGAAVLEQQLTIDTFAEDAAAIAAWLRQQDGVQSVALVGHSEGGTIALLAAAASKAESVVLLCAPGRPMASGLREQLRGKLPGDLEASAERAIAALERGEDVADVDARLAALFRPSVQPFMRSVMRLDPAALARNLRARLMIVGGGRDIQVSRLDFDALAAARPDALLRWELDMAHTLKPVTADPASQQRAYVDPSLPLADGLAAAVAQFVSRR